MTSARLFFKLGRPYAIDTPLFERHRGPLNNERAIYNWIKCICSPEACETNLQVRSL